MANEIRVEMLKTMTKTQYEVEKLQRGGNGQWFGRGARRFTSLGSATAYLESFAAEQRDVLDNGTRIDLRERRGRKVLATVGGLLDAKRVRTVRWLSVER
jgi:hypothetical protein